MMPLRFCRREQKSQPIAMSTSQSSEVGKEIMAIFSQVISELLWLLYKQKSCTMVVGILQAKFLQQVL